MNTEPRWMGATWGTVGDRMFNRAELCKGRAKAHYHRGNLWNVVATPLTWLTAVLAALSGLSVVAEYQVAATILSVVTAVLAGTNAALSPADTARSNRVAAAAYERLARKLEDAAYFETEDNDAVVPAEKLKGVRDRVRELEDELKAIEDSYPPIGGSVLVGNPEPDEGPEQAVSESGH